MSEDTGVPSTKKSEEKEYKPLVVFRRIGGNPGHARLPSDTKSSLQPIREADSATARAKKQSYKPMHLGNEEATNEQADVKTRTSDGSTATGSKDNRVNSESVRSRVRTEAGDRPDKEGPA